jgi:solute carrier family 13 (sodium-dependent dicarboxylate transporter), member 2/3/5
MFNDSQPLSVVLLDVYSPRSFAFLLPVSTPPDAIVYATNKVPLREMAKSGGIMLVACFALLLASWLSFGRFIFGVDPANFPDWADLYGLKNSTLAPAASANGTQTSY